LSPVKGTCDNCHKENILIQNSLISFYDEGDEPTIPMNICKNCFINPYEDFTWDGFNNYTTDELEKTWNKGKWGK